MVACQLAAAHGQVDIAIGAQFIILFGHIIDSDRILIFFINLLTAIMRNIQIDLNKSLYHSQINQILRSIKKHFYVAAVSGLCFSYLCFTTNNPTGSSPRLPNPVLTSLGILTNWPALSFLSALFSIVTLNSPRIISA